MILDSGERREFESGAVRDMQEGKGRFDLVPYSTLGKIFNDKSKVKTTEDFIELYMISGDHYHLIEALEYYLNIGEDFMNRNHKRYISCVFDLARHFEEGAKKYGENNWKKGIPTSSFIDSALRHYFKHLSGLKDEEHEVAFIWNVICAIWTCENKPEFNSYKKKGEECEEE